MVIKPHGAEETTQWSLHWEWDRWVLWCAELNLRADGQGPSSVIQTSRSPDLVVYGLCAQVSTLTNKQAVLDFLLWAVIMRESPTTRREGLEVKGLLTPIPASCAPGCSTTCAALTLPRSGRCRCQQTCKEKRDASEEVWFCSGLSCQTKITKAVRWRTAGFNYWAALMGSSGFSRFVPCLVLEEPFWHILQYMQITWSSRHTLDCSKPTLSRWLLGIVYLSDKAFCLCLVTMLFSLLGKNIMLISPSN